MRSAQGHALPAVAAAVYVIACSVPLTTAICTQGHPEEVYAAEWLEGTSGHAMLTASTWTPVLWDLQTCQRIAEGESIPAPDPAAIGEALALLPRGIENRKAVTAPGILQALRPCLHRRFILDDKLEIASS